MIDAESVRFSVPLPHPKLRRNTWTRSIHYAANLKREWQEAIWIAGAQAPAEDYGFGHPWERATVTYEWYSIHETDGDNIIASCKPLLDCIKATGPRPLGIIRDDGPGVDVRAVWRKARTKAAERIVVTVRRVE